MREGGYARATTAEDLHGVLCCSTRQCILVALTGPRRNAGTLAAGLGIGANLLRHHTRELEDAGLIGMEREGLRHFWSLTPAAKVVWSMRGVRLRLTASDGGEVSEFVPFGSPLMRAIEAGVIAAGRGSLLGPHGGRLTRPQVRSRGPGPARPPRTQIAGRQASARG